MLNTIISSENVGELFVVVCELCDDPYEPK